MSTLLPTQVGDPVERPMRCMGSEGENSALEGAFVAFVKFPFCSSPSMITTCSPAKSLLQRVAFSALKYVKFII